MIPASSCEYLVLGVEGLWSDRGAKQRSIHVAPSPMRVLHCWPGLNAFPKRRANLSEYSSRINPFRRPTLLLGRLYQNGQDPPMMSVPGHSFQSRPSTPLPYHGGEHPGHRASPLRLDAAIEAQKRKSILTSWRTQGRRDMPYATPTADLRKGEEEEKDLRLHLCLGERLTGERPTSGGWTSRLTTYANLAAALSKMGNHLHERCGRRSGGQRLKGKSGPAAASALAHRGVGNVSNPQVRTPVFEQKRSRLAGEELPAAFIRISVTDEPTLAHKNDRAHLGGQAHTSYDQRMLIGTRFSDCRALFTMDARPRPSA